MNLSILLIYIINLIYYTKSNDVSIINSNEFPHNITAPFNIQLKWTSKSFGTINIVIRKYHKTLYKTTINKSILFIKESDYFNNITIENNVDNLIQSINLYFKSKSNGETLVIYNLINKNKHGLYGKRIYRKFVDLIIQPNITFIQIKNGNIIKLKCVSYGGIPVSAPEIIGINSFDVVFENLTFFNNGTYERMVHVKFRDDDDGDDKKILHCVNNNKYKQLIVRRIKERSSTDIGMVNSMQFVKAMEQVNRKLLQEFLDKILTINQKQPKKYEYVWRVTKLENLRKKARTMRHTYYVYSDTFILPTPNNYSMDLFIAPNGQRNSSTFNKYLSVFFRFLPSPTNNKLPWPFKKTVTLSVLDQLIGINRYTHSYNYESAEFEHKSAFMKPNLTREDDGGIGYGTADFILWDILKQDSSIMNNGTIYFKCTLSD